MSAVVYVNGKIADAAHATVPVFDHGFLYGEGVYETLRTYRREPFLFDRHMRRLRQSAALMALDVPFSDDELKATCGETVAAHPALANDEAYIRILLTRGVGELTYNPAATPQPTLVIIVKPFPTPPDRTFTDGIRVALVSVRRNHPQALNPMIKSNNLINNALAMQEALKQRRRRSADAEPGRRARRVLAIELLRRPRWRGAHGTTLGWPAAGHHARVRPRAGGRARPSRPRDDADSGRPAKVQEAFITGTTREVTPVVTVSGTAIGDGKPGPITKQLLEAFRRKI